MNKNQKMIVLAVLTVICLTIIIWLINGGEIFTKTQILVEKKDDLFPEMSVKEWKDKFIWGLDLSALISGSAIVIGSIALFLLRTKKQLTK